MLWYYAVGITLACGYLVLKLERAGAEIDYLGRSLRRREAEHKAALEQLKRPTLYSIANRFATHYIDGPDPEALSN